MEKGELKEISVRLAFTVDKDTRPAGPFTVLRCLGVPQRIRNSLTYLSGNKLAKKVLPNIC